MIEPNDDGTISLDTTLLPIKIISLTNGESIELASQTMSAGFYLQISYK